MFTRHFTQNTPTKIRTTLAFTTLLLVAIALVPLASFATTQTLKIGLLSGHDDEDFDAALVLKNYVETHTNGTLKVELYPSGQFCSNANTCLENVQDGTLEASMSTIGGFGNLYPQGQVMDLPYLFRDARVAECVFDGDFVGQLREGVLEKINGLRLMTIANTGGWRNFATTTKLIKSPADLKGLTIRTIAADIQQEWVRKLGGNPIPIEWAKVYAALASGAVVGTKNGITDIVNMQLQEHLKYLTLDGHTYMGSLWWLNEQFWRGLTPAQQRVVYDGFQHLKTVARALPMRRQIEAEQTFREAGGTIYRPSPEEKKAFQAAAKPMEKWFTARYGNEWLHKIKTAVSDCEKKIDAEI